MPNHTSTSTGMERQPLVVDWRGRSGQHYPLIGENLDSFAMNEMDLYLVTNRDQVLWIGAAGDLVADANSRARFRRALACATAVFRLASPLDRHAAIWDLEGAVPATAMAPRAA